MKELNQEQLELVLKQVRELQIQHPKANVLFDLESQRINITYPLPNDYWEIKQFGFNEKPSHFDFPGSKAVS